MVSTKDIGQSLVYHYLKFLIQLISFGIILSLINGVDQLISIFIFIKPILPSPSSAFSEWKRRLKSSFVTSWIDELEHKVKFACFKVFFFLLVQIL